MDIKFFKKKTNEESDRVIEGYEEQEKKTPIAGYILLIFMFIAATFFGWRAIDDLRDVPSRPEPLSHCAGQFLTSEWEDLGRFQYLAHPVYEEAYPLKEPRAVEYKPQIEPPCAYSSYETRYEIPALMEFRKNSNRQLQDTEIAIARLEQDINEYKQANLAPDDRIISVAGRFIAREELQRMLNEAQKKEIDIESTRDKLQKDIKSVDENLYAKYQELMAEYRKDWRWYEFKVFLLEIIFVLPFFYLVFRGYRKLLSKNSPYTIIFTALIGVSSILFLRVLIVWFWSLFLARLLQTIWNFIQNFALLKSLVFYGGMFLSIAVFGGAVYILQKRIFDPKRVALRRLRQKQCPNCQTSLDLAGDFCPNCGRKLKEKCSVCGKDRWIDFNHCQNCAIKK